MIKIDSRIILISQERKISFEPKMKKGKNIM
jgi:hypothetical protein